MYRRKDSYYTRAKAEGYRSRAAFKLEQLAQKAPLFRRGGRVIDLGAWPGAWLQIAARAVGPSGRVVGVDLRPIDDVAENVVLVTGDVTDPATQARIQEACGEAADTILSDLAPQLSGVRARDEARAQALLETVIHLCEQLLRPGGSVVVKLFGGHDTAPQLKRLRLLFRSVRLTRPEATRKGSAEIYVIATGFQPSAHPL